MCFKYLRISILNKQFLWWWIHTIPLWKYLLMKTYFYKWLLPVYYMFIFLFIRSLLVQRGAPVVVFQLLERASRIFVICHICSEPGVLIRYHHIILVRIKFTWSCEIGSQVNRQLSLSVWKKRLEFLARGYFSAIFDGCCKVI